MCCSRSGRLVSRPGGFGCASRHQVPSRLCSPGGVKRTQYGCRAARSRGSQRRGRPEIPMTCRCAPGFHLICYFRRLVEPLQAAQPGYLVSASDPTDACSDPPFAASLRVRCRLQTHGNQRLNRIFSFERSLAPFFAPLALGNRHKSIVGSISKKQGDNGRARSHLDRKSRKLRPRGHEHARRTRVAHGGDGALSPGTARSLTGAPKPQTVLESWCETANR